MQKTVALLIVLAGVAGGGALGLSLRPAADVAGSSRERNATSDAGKVPGGESGHGAASRSRGVAEMHGGGGGTHDGVAGKERDYVKLARQIIVPVVHERETQALMLFDLALDVPRGSSENAYAVEPRLRDAFLRELMGLSYSGAFLGTYTDDRVIAELRDRLRIAARKILGDEVSDVLILDILRQEL